MNLNENSLHRFRILLNMVILSILSCLSLISCEKTKCDLMVKSEITGAYCGSSSSTTGSWTSVETEVKESYSDQSKLIIEFFPGIGEEVELSIEDHCCPIKLKKLKNRCCRPLF